MNMNKSNEKRKADAQASELDNHSQTILKVRAILRLRDEARSSADFSKSDTLREKLSKEYGVEVLDQRNGPSGWKFKDGSTTKLLPGAKIPPELTTKRKRKTAESTDAEMQSTTKGKAPKQKKQKSPGKLSAEQSRNNSLMQSMLGSTSSSSRVINGVTIESVQPGSGQVAKSGQRVKVFYVGRLKSNNKVFDSSVKRPFAFRLGRGEVIRGWDIGCLGMTIGEKRKLTIPPEKAYGKSGAPPTIPPNATLVFDVTLVEIKT